MKEVLVILTIWKRNYLEEQINAILNQQDVIIKKIIIWQNENHIDVTDILKKYENILLINSSENMKFHGRFTIPLLFDNIEYTAIFDDDTIPAKKWLSNSIRCVNTYNCIAGQNGRTFNSDGGQKGVGDSGYNNSDKLVDFVGHCWVFKTEWCKYLFMEKQVTYETGEDIQFCLRAKKFGNINSYCPKQENDNSGQTRNMYGQDNKASYKLNINHNEDRYEIFKKVRK
jgi:hypothetical protein